MNPQDQPGGGLPPQQPPQPQPPSQWPQQSYGPPNGQVPAPAAGHQDYAFIMDPGAASKKPLRLPGGNGLLGRLVVIAGGVVVLIIAIIVAASLFGGTSTNLQPLVTVAEDQTELVRVATLGSSQAVAQNAQNAAISIKLSVGSDKRLLLTYLASNNLKPSVRQLALKRSTQTDSQLATATANSTFDASFLSSLQTQLAAYQRDLKAAYATNPGPKGKALLTSQYSDAGLLLKQTQQQ